MIRNRRAVIAAVLTVVAVLAVLGATVGLSLVRNTGASRSQDDAAIAAVLPATCRMQSAVEAGMASQAFNIFWDDVHTDAHILAARLDAKDRAQGARFREAKGFIERDLGTLSIVGLQQHVPPFVVQVRDALKALALPGGDVSCA